MGIPDMDVSDRTIALLGLLASAIAVAIGWLNYRYTKRKFQTATEPQLYVGLQLLPETTWVTRQLEGYPPLDQYLLALKVKNLSTTSSVSDVCCSIRITRRRSFWQLWRRPKLYARGNTASLDPLQEQTIELHPHPLEYRVSDITSFILHEFSGDVIESLGDRIRQRFGSLDHSPAYTVHGPEPVKVTLVVNDRRPLNLTLSLAYTPALFDARDRHTRRRYSLTPFSDYPVTLSSADIDEDRLPRFFAERARARLAREGGGTFHIPMLTRWIMRDLS